MLKFFSLSDAKFCKRSIETYSKTLKYCEKSYKLDLEALKFNQSMYGFYDRAIKHAEEEHVCMLCHIELPEDIKLGLLKRLKSVNSDLKNKTNIEEELKLKEKMIKKLSSFRKDVERINELKNGLIEGIQKESNDDKIKIDRSLFFIKTIKSYEVYIFVIIINIISALHGLNNETVV